MDQFDHDSLAAAAGVTPHIVRIAICGHQLPEEQLRGLLGAVNAMAAEFNAAIDKAEREEEEERLREEAAEKAARIAQSDPAKAWEVNELAKAVCVHRGDRDSHRREVNANEKRLRRAIADGEVDAFKATTAGGSGKQVGRLLIPEHEARDYRWRWSMRLKIATGRLISEAPAPCWSPRDHGHGIRVGERGERIVFCPKCDADLIAGPPDPEREGGRGQSAPNWRNQAAEISDRHAMHQYIKRHAQSADDAAMLRGWIKEHGNKLDQFRTALRGKAQREVIAAGGAIDDIVPHAGAGTTARPPVPEEQHTDTVPGCSHTPSRIYDPNNRHE